MAGPALAGALQLTSRLVVESAVALTVGAAGAAGASPSTSVTATVTVTSVAASPSLARTVNVKALAGVWKLSKSSPLPL